MSYTQRFSEWFNPILAENADSIAIGTYDSAYASLQNYHRAVLVLDVGDMGALSSLNVQIRQAQDATGTGVKTIGRKGSTILTKAITQLTQAGGDGNQTICVELQTEELDVDNGFEHVGVRAVVAGAAVEYGWRLYAFEPRFAPVPTTTWDEIID
jgi:hypothetical protein